MGTLKGEGLWLHGVIFGGRGLYPYADAPGIPEIKVRVEIGFWNCDKFTLLKHVD